MEARRAALAELTMSRGSARGIWTRAHAGGHAPDHDDARRARDLWPQSDGLRPGRLTDDVEAPGIEALASLVKGKTDRGSGPSRVIPFAQRENERAAADPAAERRRRDAERKRLAAHAGEAAQAVADAERALEEARRARDARRD